MKKWLLIIFTVPIALIAGVYIIGALLPADHVATSESQIAAPIADVAQHIRHVERHPEWRSNVDRVEIVERANGRLTYREIGENRILFDFQEIETDTHFESTIADPGLPFGGSWTIRLVADGDETNVQITERGTVSDPLFRFFSTIIFGHHGTMNAYLEDLEAITSARPSDPA